MGILNRMRAAQIQNASLSSSYHPGDPELVKLFGGGSRTASGQNVTADTAMQLGAVHACVRRLADGVSMLPLELYRRLDGDKKEKARDLQTYRILHDQPNRYQTSMEFREGLMADLVLRGNGYAEKIISRGGFLEELVPLAAANMRPFWTNRRRGQHAYRYTEPETGQQAVFMPWEIFHLRGLSLDGGLSGLNPIEYHRETVGLGMAAQEYGARFYANDATPPIYLEHPSTFKNKERREEFRKAFIDQTTGSNRHAPVVLEDAVKVHPLGINQRDAQYIEGRKFSVNDIARIFLVPPHMIGDLERATFSNITQMSLEFVIYSLMPWFVRWEQSVSRDLLLTRVEQDTLYIKFNANGLLRGDIKTRFEAYRMGILDGHMTRNEVRLLEDLDPGPDELNDFLQPVNMEDAGDPGSETSNREQQLTEAAARRIVNKEHKALRKLCDRHPSAAERSTALSEFYREHAAFVADVMGLTLAEAEDYCGRSADHWTNQIGMENAISDRFEQIQHHQLLITAALAAH